MYRELIPDQTYSGSHIRCAHSDSDGNSKGKSKEPISRPESPVQTMATPSSFQEPNNELPPPQESGTEEDAVALSKNECRKKLIEAVEKKHCGEKDFPTLWEHGVMPFLKKFILKWCGPSHQIILTQGTTPGTRRIGIVTKEELPKDRHKTIVEHIIDLLPESHRADLTFDVFIGSIERSVSARGLSRGMPDDMSIAKNPSYFKNPRMRDSIDIDGDANFDVTTSTLGSCLLVGGRSYWLATFHPVVEAYQHLPSISVQQPSPSDRARSLEKGHEEGHDTLPETGLPLGNLTATSGIDLKKTCISHHPYWKDCEKEPPHVVTDWAPIDSKTGQANILRREPSDTLLPLKQILLKTTSDVVPRATVVSTGRMSDQQRGKVCEIPAYISADQNGAGTATREWFIEPCPYDDIEGWIPGGIGGEGDNGPAIVDAKTNALVGQVWGRNKYFGSGPRLTFFTPIGDLFDDIQERRDQEAWPQLPQDRNESEGYTGTNLHSQWSTRKSLRSMTERNESIRGDLTSDGGTSEHATPKDHALWVVGEAGASFTSITSPSPAHPSCFTPQTGTPGIVDVKTPYASTLSAEDLCDDAPTRATECSSGMRAAAISI
ncbi:hypothetical protein CORC01_02606 [Colletotrichum orchidophilum]|uniref:Uncharacterized protein n=1 Tax=Colletotrichum orchidophilum TaxID=1209926 RepID=A0A1G4BL52_9PEZI|nr:uncharacterized protein CORC01_02606 [Colletotrichum orchidophilum]OHF02027.1 hypothetical protein CORC01_02606 [Colletotrichum orchidophilum]